MVIGMKSVDKGRRGEQDIARWLYEVWFNEPPPADRSVFIRVGLGRKQPTGDLILPPDFPFRAVEVKNREVSITDLLTLSGDIGTWVKSYPAPALVFVKVKRKWVAIVVTDSPVSINVFSVKIGSVFVSLMTLQQLCDCIKVMKKWN